MRSLQGNFEKLYDILLLIKSTPDIKCISETKIQNKTYTDCGKNDPLSNIALDRYQFYHVPSPANAGGVAMYIVAYRHPTQNHLKQCHLEKKALQCVA